MRAEEAVQKIHEMLDGKEADDPYTRDAGMLKEIADLVGADFDDSIPKRSV